MLFYHLQMFVIACGQDGILNTEHDLWSTIKQLTSTHVITKYPVCRTHIQSPITARGACLQGLANVSSSEAWVNPICPQLLQFMKNKQLNCPNIPLVTLYNFVVSLIFVHRISALRNWGGTRVINQRRVVWLYFSSEHSEHTYSEPAMMIISIYSPQFLLPNAQECFIVGTWDSF